MRTVVAGLLLNDGKILACRRRSDQSHPGKWEFPGGKVEDGEEPATALIRELKEELCIDALLGEEFLRYEFAYPGKKPILLIFYWVESYEGPFDGSFFAENCWVTPNRLAALDFLEGDDRIVRELASRPTDS